MRDIDPAFLDEHSGAALSLILTISMVGDMFSPFKLI